MSESENTEQEIIEAEQVQTEAPNPQGSGSAVRPSIKSGLKFAAFCFRYVVQPIVAVSVVIGLAWLFGYAQRELNWFKDAEVSTVKTEPDELYVCSMFCAFLEAPGRCPVCGMELQKVDVPGDPKDIYGVTINPAERRLANIKTVAALNVSSSNTVEVLGKIAYDESTESTISAYVDGRVEKLMIDFTGAKVRKGEQLAVLYSPELYADQVGFLSAKQAFDESKDASERVRESNKRLYQSARKRLLEFGLTTAQVDEIEKSGKATRNVTVQATSSGTVIAKLVDEGKYVKTGTPILKLADLSKVWLNLEMFPKDVQKLKLGQSVAVSIQSNSSNEFEGKVSFVDPVVDSKTNTVNVRVVIPNEAGLIKIGDLAKATLKFTQPLKENWVVVPRDAVLINGDESVAFVETKPGRFEFRKVKVATMEGDQVTLASGIKPGEQVASSGVFMIDSTFNMRGKVSLIDPEKAFRQNLQKLAESEAESKEIEKNFAKLSEEDKRLAFEQEICPVTEVKLGTKGMGTPIRVEVEDKSVMICCEGCRRGLLKSPEKYFEILAEYKDKKSSEQKEQGD